MRHISGRPAFAVVIVSMLVVLSSCQARGQKVLTLDECLTRAFQTHPLAALSEVNVRAAEAALDEHRKSLLPPVRIAAGLSYAPHTDRTGYDPVVTDGGQLVAQVAISHTLYDGGKRGIQTDELSLDLTRTQIERRRAARDLRWLVISAFADAEEAAGVRDVQVRRLEDLTGYETLVNSLFRGGGTKYVDVLRSRIAIESARIDSLKAEAGWMSARITLAVIMGTPTDTSFVLVDSGQTLNDHPADTPGVGPDSIAGLDVELAELAAQRAEFEVNLARAERLPTVSVMGDVGYLSSFDNLRLPRGERTQPYGASFGISIDHPLFSWGVPTQRILQRELDAQGARLEAQQERRRVTSEKLRIRSELEHLRGQLRQYVSTLADAEDQYALTRAQYAGGGVTALDVLTAEQLLTDAREGFAHVRAAITRSVASLEKLTSR
jgi:outer membrane protein